MKAPIFKFAFPVWLRQAAEQRIHQAQKENKKKISLANFIKMAILEKIQRD